MRDYNDYVIEICKNANYSCSALCSLIKESLLKDIVSNIFNLYVTILVYFVGVDVPLFQQVCKAMLCFTKSFLIV